MLLILLLLFFSRGTTNAAPLALALRNTPMPDPSFSLPSCTCPDTRSVWDIIWSCFGTIFLCAWVSIHPNIPPPDEEWWRPILRRIKLMTWTILVPELMIYWAMRQYIGAREIMNDFRDLNLKWTKTHAHFLQMGGFMMFDGETRKGILAHYMRDTSEDKMFRFREMVQDGSIKLPTITKDDIEDRSKSDTLAKCIVLGQTGWFVLQCIARKVQGLIITELELITVALAVLNGFMYFFWWDKPFNVQMPVRVEVIAENDRVPFVRPEALSMKSQNTTPPSSRSRIVGVLKQLLKWLNNVFTSILPFSNLGGQVLAMLITVFFRWPKAAIRRIFRQMGEITELDPRSVKMGHVRVPTFYSAGRGTSVKMLGVAACIGILFGAIHCAGWHFIFPTHTELVIWRVCSIIIASIPAILSVYSFFLSPEHADFPNFSQITGLLALVLLILSSPIYFLARITLLVEAFLALRNLPNGAYAVSEWTTFLPHI